MNFPLVRTRTWEILHRKKLLEAIKYYCAVYFLHKIEKGIEIRVFALFYPILNLFQICQPWTAGFYFGCKNFANSCISAVLHTYDLFGCKYAVPLITALIVCSEIVSPIFCVNIVINPLGAIRRFGFDQDKNLDVLCQHLGECDSWTHLHIGGLIDARRSSVSCGKHRHLFADGRPFAFFEMRSWLSVDQPGRPVRSRRCRSSFSAGVGADFNATSR